MTQSKGPFYIQTLELGPMENFIYFINDKATNRTAIVDPAWDANEIIKQVKNNNSTITDILLTHSHYDHINAIEGILEHYDAQIHLMKDEAKFWGQYQELPTTHHGGDNIQIGNTEIKILHTPGHTPGSACYHVGNNLIAGDTLFVFGCGRCDLAGGDPEQMYHTLNDLKSGLPQDTILHPGHNYAEKTTSTIQEQIEGNPFLHFDNANDFVKYRMHDHDKVRDTPYHPILK